MRQQRNERRHLMLKQQLISEKSRYHYKTICCLARAELLSLPRNSAHGHRACTLVWPATFSSATCASEVLLCVSRKVALCRGVARELGWRRVSLGNHLHEQCTSTCLPPYDLQYVQ